MYQSDSTTEQKQSSYVKRFSIVAGSALEEAECFVASLKTLQSSLNTNSSNPAALEQDLKGAMDQYLRLTMICDILKVFNPFKSPSPQPQTASLIKQEPTETKPSLLLNPPPHNEEPRPEMAIATTSMSSGQTKPMDTITTSNAIPPSFPSRQGAAARAAPPPPHNNKPVSSTFGQTRPHEIKNVNQNKNNRSNDDGRRPLPSNSNKARSSSLGDHASSHPSYRSPSASTDNGITTEKFIETFESLLTHFSSVNKLTKDNTWERLFVHSLPKEQKDWFCKNLQGRGFKWENAKRQFLIEYSSSNNGGHRESKPPVPPDSSLARKTRYAQALLNLEMQDNDDLKEFNKKFKRYSDSAGMACDYSLLKRYVNSLAERFRGLAAPLLNHPDYANDLSKLMQHVERMEQPTFGIVEVVDDHCAHNWNINTNFKSSWPTMRGARKRRSAEDGFDSVEKRVKYQPVV
ncbi:hypothetical protein K501DRAFT_283853 [Backusella circina FSU 941]|nr:hypothetical protein K501DRAFT_283853 [Backusella circina FSU 941]